MQTIQVFKTKYGVDGWINGKLRYNGNENSIDLSNIDSRVRIQARANSDVIAVKTPGGCWFTTTSTCLTDVTGSYDFCLPFWSNFQDHLYSISNFIQLHWKSGLGITGSICSILSTLKTFGILAYPYRR